MAKKIVIAETTARMYIADLLEVMKQYTSATSYSLTLLSPFKSGQEYNVVGVQVHKGAWVAAARRNGSSNATTTTSASTYIRLYEGDEYALVETGDYF